RSTISRRRNRAVPAIPTARLRPMTRLVRPPPRDAAVRERKAMAERPILTFDSGIGGLTVLREARLLMPGRRFVYVADDAAFPYGAWEEPALRARILELFAVL